MKWFSQGIWSVETRMSRGSSENILEIESIDPCSRTQIQLLLKGTNANLKRIAVFSRVHGWHTSEVNDWFV